MNKSDILSIFDHGERNLTHAQKAGKGSAIAKGYPYYGALRTVFKKHFNSFQCMHSRGNVDKEFERTFDGFVNFVEYLGDYPADMIEPTVGRKDHDIGYVRGNFEWQSKSDNCRERALRKPSTWYKNSPTHLKYAARQQQ